MFLARRPRSEAIASFLQRSQDLPLSYAPIGIVREQATGAFVDEELTVVGHGPADFAAAKAALIAWTHFDMGWVELYPRHAPIVVGTVVAVLIRHLGFWSLNGCRVLYCVGSPDDGSRFGFAYGTLPNHAEAGEELFEVFLDPTTTSVGYRIRAASWPNATLARLGQPYVRFLQARFRRDSAEVMRQAVAARRRQDSSIPNH